MRIADFLNHGQANAIPMSHIEALTNLESRAIRRMIFLERLEGTPILSDNSTGYYLAENDLEKKQFVESMKHRASEIVRAAEAIEKSYT